jgi:hypothetical protein
MTDFITKQDVRKVSNTLRMKITDDTVTWVLENYDDYEKDDPTSTWVEIVESMLYQKSNELIKVS